MRHLKIASGTFNSETDYFLCIISLVRSLAVAQAGWLFCHVDTHDTLTPTTP